ncbi:UBX domain containing protein [Blastocystis sp. ATCC 50177/Nand II]|uniref:UBX domain containing protein n=1 Tax=Blastocystis sp. subtype 1 (strain ATCC 50177 / NandII) TaxID=478820 RepID=A0A196S4M6_BLAHN|nr:UBX domain containing protein [Blastocystis sp. ATCC 50177/Nand II]
MPIVGLNSFRHDDDDDEDSKKNNEYFAGGLGSHGGGSGLAVIGSGDGEKPKEIIITLYKNGYQEKGGAFCKKDDSDEHKRAYESLIEGYVPREYEARVRNEGVRVVVDDRRQEEYHAPPPRFGYVGNRLGTATSAETPAPAVSGHKYTSYDSSKPKTALRIRLCVGRVINVEVTEDWDYEDLYAFVTNAEPGFAFDLLGGYPPKKLAVDGTKVLASGLGGSVIRQVRK